MKIAVIKQAGGIFAPASDIEYDKTTKFKTGELYEVEIKLHRNPQHHRKMFAFFNFCFSHWGGDNIHQDEAAQFDTFRKHLTVLAGYHIHTFDIKGNLRVEAKSLSFSSMQQEEFEQCYSALINAALKHVFKTTDDNTYNQLLSFF